MAVCTHHFSSDSHDSHRYDQHDHASPRVGEWVLLGKFLLLVLECSRSIVRNRECVVVTRGIVQIDAGGNITGES